MAPARRRLNAIAHHLNPVTLDPNTDTVLAMEEERQKTAFDVRELTYFLDGGKKTTALKERLVRLPYISPLIHRCCQLSEILICAMMTGMILQRSKSESEL